MDRAYQCNGIEFIRAWNNCDVFSSVISRAKRFELRLSSGNTRRSKRSVLFRNNSSSPCLFQQRKVEAVSIIRCAIQSEVPPEYSWIALLRCAGVFNGPVLTASIPILSEITAKPCGINEVCRVDCGLANGTGGFHSLSIITEIIISSSVPSSRNFNERRIRNTLSSLS